MQDINDKLIDLAASYYDDFEAFWREAFDWKSPELAKYGGLDNWQAEFGSDLCRDIISGEANEHPVKHAVAAGHSCGKTALISVIILWYMVTRPNARIRATANSENQLRSILWPELALWHKRCLFKDWFEWEATRFSKKGARETWFAEAITNNPNSPEAFAGLHGRYVMVIFDEASGIDQKIWNTVAGVFSDPGNTHICFGNPTQPSGGFYDCFHHPKLSSQWKTRHINVLETKVGNTANNRAILEAWGADSDEARVRVLGQFPRTASGQFIASDDARDAMDRRISPEEYEHFPVFIGIDVARHGDDSTVITVRQGPKILEMERFKIDDLMEVAQVGISFVKRYAKNLGMCYVDSIGYGAGVLDAMRRYDDRVQGVEVSRRASNQRTFKNLRIELWYRMREWVRSADIPNDEQLFNDMTQIEYGFSDNGQMYLEKKELMKRRGLKSPDAADSIAITFARPEEMEYEFMYEDDDDAWGQREYAGRNRLTGY